MLACFEHTAKNPFLRHYAISDLFKNSAGGSMALFTDLCELEFGVTDPETVENMTLPEVQCLAW